MPWTSKDAERHKKDLTAAQKEKWASIANSVLKQCLKDGSEQSVCEGRAVRIANSMSTRTARDTSEPVMRLYAEPPRQLHEIASGEIREIKHDEQTGVLTAEVVISREAVLPYQADKGIVYEYIPADELKRDEFLRSAHGKPVTVGHPAEEVVTMDTLSEHAKGSLHGPFVAVEIDGVLSVVGKETIWDPGLISDILAGKKRQVSVGRWTVLKDEQGEFRGQRYNLRQTQLVVNHLAHTDTGRQGNGCRILLDTAGWDTINSEIETLFDLPSDKLVEGLETLIVRHQTDVPALEYIADGIVTIKRRLMKAILVAGDTENGAVLKAALEGLNSEWPDLKADAIPPVTKEKKLIGGDPMPNLSVTVHGKTITLSEKSLNAIDEPERKALSDALAEVSTTTANVDKELVKAKADLKTATDELTATKTKLDASGQQIQGLKDEFIALKAQVDKKATVDGVAQEVTQEVEERTKLLDAIRLVNPSYGQQGRTTAEMKRDLLAAFHADMKETALKKDDKGNYILADAYVQARVDLVLEGVHDTTGGSFGARLLRPIAKADSPIDAERKKRLGMYKGTGGGK